MSTFIGERSLAILIMIVGLVLFAHLIGNMQSVDGQVVKVKEVKTGNGRSNFGRDSFDVIMTEI